jgi:hypothetical protein
MGADRPSDVPPSNSQRGSAGSLRGGPVSVSGPQVGQVRFSLMGSISDDDHHGMGTCRVTHLAGGASRWSATWGGGFQV